MREHESFAAFWPCYLREHSRPANRALHYAGTSLVVLLALAALVTGSWWLLAALPVAGYGFRLGGAFWGRAQSPRDFHLPALVARGRFPNVVLWLTGRLAPHLERAGIGLSAGAQSVR